MIMKKLSMGTLALTSALLFCVGCEQSTNEKCALPSSETAYTFRDGDLEVSEYLFSYLNESREYTFASGVVTPELYTQIGSMVSDREELRSSDVVFYISEGIDQVINRNEVKAFLTYTITEGRYHIQFFELKKGQYDKDHGVDIRTTRIGTQLVNFLREKIQREYGKKMLVVQLNNNAMDVSSLDQKALDEYPNKWRQIYGQKPAYKTNGPIDGCPQPCGGSIGKECVQYDPLDPQAMYCPKEESSCLQSHIGDDLYAANLSSPATTELDATFDTPLHYEFRDSIFAQYSKGLSYIDDYYYASDVLDTISIPLSISLDTFQTLILLNNILNKIGDPATYGNDIAINASAANQILALIDAFLDLSTDEAYQTKLSDVKADILSWKGLTVNQIIATL
jgi:hypothetical protein